MTAPINNGGPAFPTPTALAYVPGLTLRDWFAGQATEDDIRDHLGKYQNYAWEFTREQAKYRYAAAMLEAREASK